MRHMSALGLMLLVIISLVIVSLFIIGNSVSF